MTEESSQRTRHNWGLVLAVLSIALAIVAIVVEGTMATIGSAAGALVTSFVASQLLSGGWS